MLQHHYYLAGFLCAGLVPADVLTCSGGGGGEGVNGILRTQ